MERYYDGDQEALFKAAHVINPYMKPKTQPKVRQTQTVKKRYNNYYYYYDMFTCQSVCECMCGLGGNIHNFLT